MIGPLVGGKIALVHSLLLVRQTAVPNFKTMTDAERFWTRVNKAGPVHPVLLTNCWEWTGSGNENGYGLHRHGSTSDGTRRNSKAHRYAWMLVYGEIDSKIHVLHKCDNPKCVNLEHLFLGNPTLNMLDRDIKGRCPKGEDANFTKLTEEQALEVLRWNGRSGENLTAMAKRMGVVRDTLYAIRQGITWKHLHEKEGVTIPEHCRYVKPVMPLT